MGRLIATAETVEVEIVEGKYKVLVQELPYHNVFKALGIIRQVISKAKEFGSIDSIIDAFKEADSDKTPVDKVLDALELLLGTVGDDPLLLPNLISLGVGKVTTTASAEIVENITAEELGELGVHDILKLAKAFYEVNWIKGSLKKAVAEVGLNFGKEEESSNNSSETPKTLSESPQPAKT